MKSLFVLVALGAIMVAGNASAQTTVRPWLNADVTAYIETWQKSSAPKSDPFIGPEPSAYSGKQVLLEFELTGPDGKADFFSWSYDREAKALKLTARAIDISATNTFKVGGDFTPPLAKLSGFYLTTDRRSVATDRRENSYGASAEVEVVVENQTGVASYSPTGGGLPPGDRFGTYDHTLTIEPEEARSLVPYVRFMALGVIQDNSDGHPVMCGSHYYEPTIRHPVEVSGDACILNVTWVAFAFIDKRTGAQLRTWG
ncbi:hypothetical protein [Brevundimonas naejangsanensis]|uniref:hypothetical protein n=1 Tax=Brevundimonas naejangsanensis TaxID=588932 RepID=UPI003D04A057